MGTSCLYYSWGIAGGDFVEAGISTWPQGSTHFYLMVKIQYHSDLANPFYSHNSRINSYFDIYEKLAKWGQFGQTWVETTTCITFIFNHFHNTPFLLMHFWMLLITTWHYWAYYQVKCFLPRQIQQGPPTPAAPTTGAVSTSVFQHQTIRRPVPAPQDSTLLQTAPAVNNMSRLQLSPHQSTSVAST